MQSKDFTERRKVVLKTARQGFPGESELDGQVDLSRVSVSGAVRGGHNRLPVGERWRQRKGLDSKNLGIWANEEDVGGRWVRCKKAEQTDQRIEKLEAVKKLAQKMNHQQKGNSYSVNQEFKAILTKCKLDYH